MNKVRPVGKADRSAKERLLLAAGQLMTERNSSDVSLSEIASRSGLNSALVKYYFGNKAGLMMDLLRKIILPLNEELAFLLSRPISPPEKMRIHISGIVNTYYRFPYINRLMHDLLAEDRDLFGPLIADEFSKPAAEAQRRIIEDGVRDGYFRPVDPVLFYFHVMGACNQFFYAQFDLEYVFGSRSIDREMKRAFINHLCETVFSGILVKPFEIDASED
jgi:AcrR family transcriptional regulator